MTSEILSSKPTRLFLFLGGFFIANAMLAEFIGIKIFSLEKLFGFAPLSMTLFGVHDLGFNLTAGVLLWPVVFVMTDIINELLANALPRSFTGSNGQCFQTLWPIGVPGFRNSSKLGWDF